MILDRFVALARRAASAAERLPDHLVLLGAVPDRLELDYGWLQPGSRLSHPDDDPIHTVQAPLEHPTLAEADILLNSGALWNTGAFATKVETLWALIGMRCSPSTMPCFAGPNRAVGGASERPNIEITGQDRPWDDFFSGLIRHGPKPLAVLPLTGVLWSDWGKPERITEMLRRIGRSPAFPLNCLDRPFVPLPFLSAPHQSPAQV